MEKTFTVYLQLHYFDPLQVRGRHFASHDIQERLEELKGLHEALVMEAEKKMKLLQEALSIHTFLSEVSIIVI